MHIANNNIIVIYILGLMLPQKIVAFKSDVKSIVVDYDNNCK